MKKKRKREGNGREEKGRKRKEKGVVETWGDCFVELRGIDAPIQRARSPQHNHCAHLSLACTGPLRVCFKIAAVLVLYTQLRRLH